MKPKMTIVGIECRTSNSPNAAPIDIPKLWGRFFNENVPGKVPHKNSDDIIALYCDYESDYTGPYTLIIGCPVSHIENLPEGQVSKEIPDAKYQEFLSVGEHPQALIQTWQDIWSNQKLQRTYTGDFEVYDNKFFSDTLPKEVRVYIAVE